MASATVSAVAPGDQTEGIEYVVEETDSYVIVDKKDRYEQFVVD